MNNRFFRENMTRSDTRSPDDGDSSVANRIARVLSERVVRGVLVPGAPVRQDRVALEFHASHVPVREAFRKLEAQGLLVSEPRRGVRVAPLDPSALLEITEMRASLEVLALRHAFKRLTAEQLSAAARALSDAEASRDIVVLDDANQRFHRAITSPCQMPRLIAMIDELHQADARFLFATWRDLDWQPRSDQEHEAILDHLRGGRIGAATRTLKEHIQQAGEALMNRLREAT